MVAHLLRLKLALLRNSLRRSVAALVGMIIGGLYAAGFVLVGVGALVALRAQPDRELAHLVVVLGGSVLVAGWALLPMLFFGVDPTLDPARFATFAVPERSLAAGLLLTGLVGIPGVASLLLGLGLVAAGSQTVLSTVVALLGVTLGLASCVLLSRILTAAASATLASRRGREVAGIGGLALVICIGPLFSAVGEGKVDRGSLVRLGEVLAWTPLGWPWAASGDVADGRTGQGLLRLLLAAVWCAVLFLVWERLLASVLLNPRTVSSGRGGRQLGLGLFNRLPGTPLGAIAARAGSYWLRDPRLNFPAIMTMLLPAGLLIPGVGSDSRLALVMMPVASAYLIGWGQHNDVGYDGTAFWMHVASGVDGVSDRLGRLFPSMVLAVVCVPVYAVLGPLLGAPWGLLPATLGVAVAFALNGFAVACVASAVKQYAVPAPGENPFTSRPGSVGVTLAVQSLCGVAVLGLSLPALGLGAAAWFGVQWAAWAALLVGPGLGVVALVVGVRLGAQLFERRQTDLLQDLTAMA